MPNLYRWPPSPARQPGVWRRRVLVPPAAVVTGTITASVTEADIVTGGKTIIITLTGDTWVSSGANFDAQRLNIIQGLDSAQGEALGWNAKVRDLEVAGAVVRTSDTVATITLTASATYDITAQETITVTVPASALIGGVAVTATPTFTVDPTSTGESYGRHAIARGATGGILTGSRMGGWLEY